MQLNIPILADYEMIRAKRQARINYNAEQEQAKRLTKDYTVGDQVLIITDDTTKLEDRAHGPYTIQQVHTSGTVMILCTPTVYKRINIRHIKPYRQ